MSVSVVSRDPSGAKPHITVCVCTCQRPVYLGRLLDALKGLELGRQCTISVVVADNDERQTARPLVTEATASATFPITYCVEPHRNIAMARNCALAHATGDFVAFIDDDEVPTPGWLVALLKTCQESGADGVLGPVRPKFECEAPRWAIRGRFFERPEHPTGYQMPWAESRTGNVLLRRVLVESDREPFNPAFATGGEDVDFFRRQTGIGRRFVWCNEAVAYEWVPATRCRRAYLLRRALLRGRNSLKNPAGWAWRLVKSCLAVVLYALALPVLLLAGEHYFLRYLIKLCDHSGRLLAVVGLNPVKERDM